MKIQSNLSANTGQAVGTGQADNSRVNALTKQIDSLERLKDSYKGQLQKVNENKELSEEIKTEKRKALQEKITGVEKQIMEVKTELAKAKAEPPEKSKKQLENESKKEQEEALSTGVDISISKEAMKRLTLSNTHLQDAQSFRLIKLKMKSEMVRLENNAANDGFVGSYNAGQIESLSSGISQLDKAILASYGKSNQEMKRLQEYETEAAKVSGGRKEDEIRSQDEKEGETIVRDEEEGETIVRDEEKASYDVYETDARYHKEKKDHHKKAVEI